jgi:hypothetical protein
MIDLYSSPILECLKCHKAHTYAPHPTHPPNENNKWNESRNTQTTRGVRGFVIPKSQESIKNTHTTYQIQPQLHVLLSSWQIHCKIQIQIHNSVGWVSPVSIAVWTDVPKVDAMSVSVVFQSATELLLWIALVSLSRILLSFITQGHCRGCGRCNSGSTAEMP